MMKRLPSLQGLEVARWASSSPSELCVQTHLSRVLGVTSRALLPLQSLASLDPLTA